MTQVFITGGVHGNEPSGALALEPLRQQGFSVFGPCNPWGLKHGKRALESGRDLNRAFARTDCPEAQAVRQAVREARPDLLLDLHEDALATAPYLIQFGPRFDIGRRLAEALSSGFKFAPRPRFGPLRGRAGVLKPGRFSLWLVEMSGWWPLGFWFWRAFERPAIVVEAPGAYTPQQRLEFLLAVAAAARGLTSQA